MLIKSGDGGWVNAAPALFAGEVEFQALVKETFDQVLATQSDAPAVIAREVVMPDQGKLDVLGIDTDGVISVCECKLFSNAGARRAVLGQVLEYAGQLNGIGFRDFRTRVEARLGGDLLEAIESIAPDEFDREVWVDEVTDRLESGRFRVVIATDAITPTLKQTVLYLNDHTDLPVMAVELQRAKLGEVEVLVPTVFAEEQARRKAPAPSPASTPTIEDADVAVVAATHALADYENYQAYICQPKRSFRPSVEFMGFYAKRRIEPFFPKVVAFRPELVLAPETISKLRASGEPVDARVADIIEKVLSSDDGGRIPGESYQVVPLDPEGGFELSHAIKHNGLAAWLRGQRYTSSAALKTNPPTTDELKAAGG
jgi:hypothetical protein